MTGFSRLTASLVLVTTVVAALGATGVFAAVALNPGAAAEAAAAVRRLAVAG
jgi:hypothetical protein